MLGKQPNLAETWSNTIVSFESPHKLRDLSMPERELAPGQNQSVEQQKFKIRLASSSERVQSASMLIHCEELYVPVIIVEFFWDQPPDQLP